MKTIKPNNQAIQSFPNSINKVKRNQKKDIYFAPPLSRNNQFHLKNKINLQKKISFSEKEKSKQQLREICKETLHSLDIIFSEYDTEKLDWKKKFCDLMKDYVDISNLSPVPLNEKGNLIFENFKFWVLFIKFKEETSVISISQAISLFNQAYSTEFDNKAYEFINTFYLNFINTKYSKTEIYNQLLISKNKFIPPVKPQNVQINHYKYLTDYPEYFVFTEFDKKLNTVDDSSLICSPSHYSSKCSSLNNSIFSTLAGKYPLNFEKIKNQTIYFNPQFNLFSANHSLNTSLVERDRPNRVKNILKFDDKELSKDLVNSFILEEQTNYIRKFDSLSISNENIHLFIQENELVKRESSFYLEGNDETITIYNNHKNFKINKDIKKGEEIIYKIQKSKKDENDIIIIHVKRKLSNDILLIDKKILDKFSLPLRKENTNVDKPQMDSMWKENKLIGKKRLNNLIDLSKFDYFSVRTRSQRKTFMKH